MTASPPVYVIGGGWAGLSAAIELCRQKIPVTIIEAGKQLGGKTRRIAFEGSPVDQSQIMLFGGYGNMLRIFRMLKIRENQDYERVPFDLVLRRKRKTKFRFRLYGLPTPYGLRAGLLLARGLQFQDKIRALRLIDNIRRNRITLDNDIPVSEFLMRHDQGDRAIRFFWRPLCRMFLHTDVNRASTEMFLQALSWLFLADPANGDILLMHQDLSTVFSDRAMDYIEQKGGMIKLGHEVTALDISDGAISGVRTDDAVFAADRVIVAAAATNTRKLLRPHAAAAPLVSRLERLEFAKLTTVYLKYPSETTLPMQIIHTMGTLGHWVLDKRVQGNPGVIAVSILERPQTPLHSDSDTCEEICSQLSILFPYWKDSISCHVSHSPEAILAAGVGTLTSLLESATAIKGLWLAGDFIDTRLLPSLESAVCSGLTSAQQIITSMGQSS